MTAVKDAFRELLENKRKYIETFFVVENKLRQKVPFIYNPIQAMADEEETGMDVWLKPSQVGFSTERIAKRLTDTLTIPGTNTILVAYEDFITERLLNKVNFFYGHLESLRIPGFPVIRHNSTYEKTFQFIVDGAIMGESTIYIASARSKTAGRAETIHHLLLDEPAFYVPQAVENIIAPALARIPPNGTCDVFSTPNGEENWFHDTYVAAKEGRSEFTSHFFPWWLLPEYAIEIGDPRLRTVPEVDKPEFKLLLEEDSLMHTHGLSWSQIRWRRWMNKRMESSRRKGDTTTLFCQEFPEDDVSCFLSTGDMFYPEDAITRLHSECYDAPIKWETTHVWYPPEDGWQYQVIVDPSQAKITQSAISVQGFRRDPETGNIQMKWCARNSGWYDTEDEYRIACELSDKYNRALLAWEANGHGLAFTILARKRRPIYFRTDLLDGIPTQLPGWYTSGGKGGTKDYMLGLVRRELHDLICHDIELVRQLSNFRTIDGKLEIVGMDDIHDTLAIGVAVHSPNPIKRGLQGRTGYRQDWGKRKGSRRRHRRT